MHLKDRIMITLGLFLAVTITSCSEKVTIKSLLAEMANRESLSYFPEQEFLHKQFSSYNRASISPDKGGWFANNDMSHFIRVEENLGRREFVMFDTDGPGAIVRWWMTFYKAQKGTIRIYIDKKDAPVIAGSPDSLLSGNLIAPYPFSVSLQKGAPIGDVGRDYDHNLYFPIPFSKHCKITYECDSLKILYDYEGTPVPQGYYWPDIFYNIGFRLYSKSTIVESFTMQALQNEKELIEETGSKLMANKVQSSQEENYQKLLKPNDSLVIGFNRKEFSINRLSLQITASDKNQALRSAVIKISFDGLETVWVPVGDFFGSGYCMQPHRTWMNSRDDNGLMESNWVMPFKENCTVTIVNYGNQEIELKGSIGLNPYHWNYKSMYFGSSWHEYYNINSQDEKKSAFDINFVSVKGRGVYVGDQVNLFNNTYFWWGEGDEKIFVDGEVFPSSFGTGSEDYYGYSFGRQEAFSHPFLSQPVGIGNMDWGLVVNMRHRSLDAIPFKTSISANIELWHWANVKMNYSLTSYYYLLPPFEINIKPNIESVRFPVVLKKGDMESIKSN